MIYTIEVPDSNQPEPRHTDFFDWLESTEEGSYFLSECFSGNVCASQARAATRQYGLSFKSVWATVLACYFNDHPVIEEEPNS